MFRIIAVFQNSLRTLSLLRRVPVGHPSRAAMTLSRWILHSQALFWRSLMSTGMALHHLGPPPSPAPLFTRTIPATLSATRGDIGLLFYAPPSYSKPTEPLIPETTTPKLYPALINFHGGGFTIGDASDDARWCHAVVDQCHALVISVNYRRAPEFPFPTAVEDGADAVLWVLQHANELQVDCARVGISGFSAGGNMAFTVPLRLAETTCTISVIIAWYPSTDFTNPRASRRMTNLRPEKGLPEMFTNLFDASYLHPQGTVAMDSPYLSPGVAPKELLRRLPDDICIYTCEWDELLAEAERFRGRLEEECEKRVRYKMFKGTRHAWDKNPNPMGRDVKREAAYSEACAELKRVWGAGE